MSVRRSSYRKSARIPKKTIIQHLAEVLAEAHKPVKVKTEEGRNHYLRVLDIANAVRDDLLARGLLLIPNDLAWWCKQWLNSDGRVVTQCGVETEFELTDGTTTKHWKSFGMGQDLDGFATAIAQTMAIKAWLKRVGLIFGEEDDPEKEQRSIDAPAYPREVSKIVERQSRALNSALHASGLDRERAEKILSQRLEQTITLECVPELPKKLFDFAIKVLLGQRDLAEDLERSVEAVKQNGKPQPVVSILDRTAGD